MDEEVGGSRRESAPLGGSAGLRMRHGAAKLRSLCAQHCPAPSAGGSSAKRRQVAVRAPGTPPPSPTGVRTRAGRCAQASVGVPTRVRASVHISAGFQARARAVHEHVSSI